jgi:hypothetical protein
MRQEQSPARKLKLANEELEERIAPMEGYCVKCRAK